MSETTNVFISYARADGIDHSLKLRDELKAQGITCWRDESIDPTVDFTGEIEKAFESVSHVAVIITPDVKRVDSFVRLEIGYALVLKKRIIPLVFTGGHRPITIINHTYIDFGDWDKGFAALLERLKDFGSSEIDPKTLQERELSYIQQIGQLYDHWRDLYTDMAAIARIEERKVKLKGAAQRYLDMRHKTYERIDHSPEAEKGVIITSESFDELREAIRKYKRVALIGDPGAGKTTTLERLAYELAADALDETDKINTAKPLPLFVRLGAYTGDDFLAFIQSFFGGLSLKDYLPSRVFLLLDGLNEMPYEHLPKMEAWLSANPEVSVIVSCRKLDYIERKLPLQRIDVAPLDLERIRLFMSNYLDEGDLESLFWALAGHEARRSWDWYRSKNKQVSYRDFFAGNDTHNQEWIPEYKILLSLRKHIREDSFLPDMLGVVTNPFLLFAVIEIYHSEGEIPRKRGDLFKRFVDALLAERGKIAESDERPWIPETVQKQALAALAYRMQEEKTGTSVTQEFVLETFADVVKSHDPKSLLYFALSASILEQSGSIRFSHQLLQEYFAAYEMGEDLRRGVPANKYFPSNDWWIPTGWEETALLLAGILGDADKVVEWLAPTQPDLAYKVAIESGAECSERVLEALYQPKPGARRSPYALAEWGRKIAGSDSRVGVGLKTDGLPDIAWGGKIRAGKYTIGGDKQAYQFLQLQEVQLDYTYRLAKFPITMIQFEAFVNDKIMGFHLDDWWRDFPPSYNRQSSINQSNPYPNHPAENVTWYQAVAFCRWLTAKYHAADLLATDLEIRLPTQEEWEIAARYPDGREYPWGNEYKVGYANCDEQRLNVGPYFLNRTTAVGLYELGKHNELDLYDMAGTVWEWCLTKYKDGSNQIDASDDTRVLRGGSWRSRHMYTRSASRDSFNPFSWLYYYGFRLCESPIEVLYRTKSK